MSEQSPLSPLEQAIRDAEAAIDAAIARRDTEWKPAPGDWVVGCQSAVASRDDGRDEPVTVFQAFGKRPELGQVRYGAQTPRGEISWRAGASALYELRRSEGQGPWGQAALAIEALGLVGKAVVPDPPKTQPVEPQPPARGSIFRRRKQQS